MSGRQAPSTFYTGLYYEWKTVQKIAEKIFLLAFVRLAKHSTQIPRRETAGFLSFNRQINSCSRAHFSCIQYSKCCVLIMKIKFWLLEELHEPNYWLLPTPLTVLAAGPTNFLVFFIRPCTEAYLINNLDSSCLFSVAAAGLWFLLTDLPTYLFEPLASDPDLFDLVCNESHWVNNSQK